MTDGDFCVCGHLAKVHHPDCRGCPEGTCDKFGPVSRAQHEAVQAIGQMLDEQQAPLGADGAGRRPDRATVEELLAANGQHVQVRRHHLVEDADGAPLRIDEVVDGDGSLHVTLEQLGWTQAEWDDPTITR